MNKLKELIDKNLLNESVEYLNSMNIELPIKLYNLGYISHKKGELAKSIFYLEKAKSEGLFSIELDESMNKVKSDLGLIQVEASYSQKDQIILHGQGVKVDVYYSLIIIFSLIGFGIFKLVNKYLSILVLLPVALIIFMINTISPLTGAINLDEMPIYRGPSRIFEQVQTLTPGVKVLFSKENKDWKYIEYPEVFRGWVYKNKALKL
jgi:hypothetical protein